MPVPHFAEPAFATFTSRLNQHFLLISFVMLQKISIFAAMNFTLKYNL